jgi:hypothetical protein
MSSGIDAADLAVESSVTSCFTRVGRTSGPDHEYYELGQLKTLFFFWKLSVGALLFHLKERRETRVLKSCYYIITKNTQTQSKKEKTLHYTWMPNCSSSQRHFLFGQMKDHLCRCLLALKNMPIPLLPNIPGEVHKQTRTSTIWLYTSGKLFTSQAVRLENRLWCPRRFSTPVM